MGKTPFQLPRVPPTLFTEDLVLRPIAPSDALAYFRLCSDTDVMNGWGTAAHTEINETRALISFLSDQLAKGSMLRWGIALKKAPEELIGDVGYWRFVPVRYRGELGAKLSKCHWQKSYMTQALGCAIEAGFEHLGLNSVEGNIEVDNTASIRLVEKLGFVKEGLVRQHTYSSIKERFMDTYLYSIVKDQWMPWRAK